MGIEQNVANNLRDQDFHDPISSFVDTRVAKLKQTTTAKQALAQLKQTADKLITIYTAYIVDGQNKLIGVVSMRDLLSADETTNVGSLMKTKIVSTYADEDQEIGARRLLQHDFIGLPIITRDGQLLGMLSRKQANRIMAQEQTEDFEKMMAIGGSHQAGVYLETSVFGHFRKRIGWLIILAILGFVSGSILHAYEEALMTFIILALYIPMIADTGGNVGSQSATVVIRALALNEIHLKDASKVIFKELWISLMVAIVLGGVTLGKIYLLSGNMEDLTISLGTIGLAITLALMLQVVTSTLVGALLPLAVSRFNLDPATVASPALTTVVDITGLLIFFKIATVVLGVG